MKNNTQYQRIEKMENTYNDVSAMLVSLEKTLDHLENELPKCEELFDYYINGEWRNDADASRKPNFLSPEDFPHGVLSEDAVFEEIGNLRELAIRMLKLGTKMVEI